MLQRAKASSPSWACVFPPGGPLRRGGVYPLKAGGAKRCAELYGAERDVGAHERRTRSFLGSLDPTYLTAGCVPQKGGVLTCWHGQMVARVRGRG